MSLVYIGAFPPGYGGVTVKNLNLYTAIKRHTEIDKIDLSIIKRGNVKDAFRLILSLLDCRNRFVIGVSGRKTRKRFCGLLYLVNRRSMRRSILIVMGGTASRDMANDKQYQKYVRCYQTIYVETKGMLDELSAAGLENGAIYPNCRFKPDKFRISVTSNINSEMPLKCVFFSFIQEEKGVDIILKAAQKLPEIGFYFYGSIDSKFEDTFKNEIDRLDNITYKGIFTGADDERYTVLSKYDILLLPTRWEAEGVPGIIVESRIAGLVPIVSDHNFNNELVKDGEDGILLRDKTDPDELANSIMRLCSNRSLYDRLRQNSLKRAEDYYIENYVDMIVTELRFDSD